MNESSGDRLTLPPGWGKGRVNRWLRYHSEISYALTMQRTALESALIPISAYILVACVEAYRRYIVAATPFVEARGGELVFLGRGGEFLVGPADERWDAVMLVKQRSVTDFMAFASDAGYLKVLGHRTAALADSRLLPMIETAAL